MTRVGKGTTLNRTTRECHSWHNSLLWGTRRVKKFIGNNPYIVGFSSTLRTIYKNSLPPYSNGPFCLFEFGTRTTCNTIPRTGFSFWKCRNSPHFTLRNFYSRRPPIWWHHDISKKCLSLFRNIIPKLLRKKFPCSVSNR